MGGVVETTRCVFFSFFVRLCVWNGVEVELGGFEFGQSSERARTRLILAMIERIRECFLFMGESRLTIGFYFSFAGIRCGN